MTDKELKKLKKSELLELLLYMRKEIDSLKVENQSLEERIEEIKQGSMKELLRIAKSNEEKLDMFCSWLLSVNEDGSADK